MTTTLALTDQQIDSIYAVLHNVFEAPISLREDFAVHFPGCGEYRFQGALGFGGKVYADHARVWVDYYTENRTPALDADVAKANATIEKIINTTDLRVIKLAVVDALDPDRAAGVMSAALTRAAAAGDWHSVGHLLLVLARYAPDEAAELRTALEQTGIDITPDPDEAAWIAAQPAYEPTVREV